MSNRTIRNKRLSLLFELMHVIIVVGPVLYFILDALIFAGLTTKETLVLSASAVACIILSLLNIILRVFKHSKFWILIIGLTLVLPNITNFIIIFGVCNIVDELIIEPLHRHFKNKYIINKEIDLR